MSATCPNADSGVAAARPRYEALGRLPVLGPTLPWHAALLLPLQFDDLTAPLREFAIAPREARVAFVVRVDGTPTTSYPKGIPRLSFFVVDARGERARASIFGDARELAKRLLVGQEICVVGILRPGELHPFLNVVEVVGSEWVGRLRPVYPSKANVISADKVRERVFALLDDEIPRAAANLAGEVLRAGAQPRQLLEELGCPGWSFAQLLEQAHRPRDIIYARHARRVLTQIAALIGLARAQAGAPPVGAARALALPTLKARLDELPASKTPTADQRAAIDQFARALNSTRAARAMLSGDVGTGKHLVLAAIAVAAAEDRARVAILLPNIVLARQFERELVELFPSARTAVVTGSTRRAASVDTPIVIGTTALLTRNVGSFEIVCVDENHKFARHQREHHVGPGTHLLEATATAIPRSLALTKLGVTELAVLRQAPFPKSIRTTLWSRGDRQQLFANVRRTVAAGDQVLVVYPERGDGESVGAPAVQSAFDLWNRKFPGRVRALTGEDSDTTKLAVVSDLLERRADIVISTVVIECGLNAPGLRRVMIVHPERFGAAQLHQIRGRVARLGGEGHCDLYCPASLTERAAWRIQTLLDHADGFALAEADMRLRGFGDLSPGSKKQSGADDSILFGQPLTLEAIESILPIWSRLTGASTR